jgi:hypothetical protein
MTNQARFNDAQGREMPATLQERERAASQAAAGVANWYKESGVDGVSPAERIRLWDNVDNTWTNPLERGMVHNYYLRKVVTKCSVCKTASAFSRDVSTHIDRTEQQHRDHEGAELGTTQGTGSDVVQICSGCGMPFALRKGQGRRHLERMKTEGPLHKGAGVVTIHQFSLAPPAPVAADTNNGTGPVDIQVERSSRRRRRSRPRSRRR